MLCPRLLSHHRRVTAQTRRHRRTCRGPGTPAGLRKKKWIYGKTRDEVHEKWVKLQDEARKGPVASSVPTVGEYVQYWHENVVRPNCAPLTIQTYGTYIRLYIVPGLGTKRLDRLEVRDVQLWINKVARTCQCCAQGKDARRSEQTALLRDLTVLRPAARTTNDSGYP